MMFLKALATVVIIAALGVTGYYFWISMDSKPRHPALASATLPPLISVRDFYANMGAEWAYTPSFDGSLVAWYSVEWTKKVIKIGPPAGSAMATFSGKVDGFFWSPYENKLNVIAERRLWKVDPQNPDKSNWVDITPRGFTSWNIQALPKGPDDVFIVASNDRVAEAYDLYTVRADGGGKQLLVQNEGNTQKWFLDDNKKPVLRINRADGDNRSYQVLDEMSGNWRAFALVSPADDVSILNYPDKDGTINALSNRGRDKLAYVELDTKTGTETVLREDENNEIIFIRGFSFFSRNADTLLYYKDGYPEVEGLSDHGGAFAKLVQDGENPAYFEFIGSSPDGRFVTVARSPQEQSFEYFLYDLQEGTSKKIGSAPFRKYAGQLAETKPVNFKARDGLEIPALLTLPKGAKAQNLPTIVEVHGGPASVDLWGYDSNTQFLANRGYAVLSVNFRGSTGYGKAFRQAGYGEIGKKMQDDIVDAAHWLVDQGIADKDNMAIMGGSYGGYAAAEAMVRDPGTFKAAIAEYGVMDIAYQMKNNPFAWGLFKDEMVRYFGDPDVAGDLAAMREHSPISHPENVEGTILLTAGKEDRIVGFEQTEEFERALKAANKSVAAVYFEKEGHGYSRWQTKVRRARLVEHFLAKHLGGRNGNFDLAEIAAEYLN